MMQALSAAERLKNVAGDKVPGWSLYCIGKLRSGDRTDHRTTEYETRGSETTDKGAKILDVYSIPRLTSSLGDHLLRSVPIRLDFRSVIREVFV